MNLNCISGAIFRAVLSVEYTHTQHADEERFVQPMATQYQCFLGNFLKAPFNPTPSHGPAVEGVFIASKDTDALGEGLACREKAHGYLRPRLVAICVRGTQRALPKLKDPMEGVVSRSYHERVGASSSRPESLFLSLPTWAAIWALLVQDLVGVYSAHYLKKKAVLTRVRAQNCSQLISGACERLCGFKANIVI